MTTDDMSGDSSKGGTAPEKGGNSLKQEGKLPAAEAYAPASGDYTPSYSRGWKDQCREILRVYARVKSIAQGKSKPLGYTVLRNEILAEYNKSDRDRRLTVYDVKGWLNEESAPGDRKFRFIDTFIRKIDITDDNYAEVRSSLIKERDRTVRESLASIYCSPKINENLFIQSSLNQLSGRTYTSPVVTYIMPKLSADYSLNREIKQVVIHFYDHKQHVIGVKCLYLYKPLDELGSIDRVNRRNSIAYFGYFLPNSTSDDVGLLHGTLLLFLQWARGIDTLCPSQSSQLYAQETDVLDWNFHFNTERTPQIAAPHFSRNLDLYPNNVLVPEAKADFYQQISEDSLIIKGDMSFFTPNKHQEFIAEYLENLTEEYLSW